MADITRKLADQILAQNKTQYWTGEGGGSTETNALWMGNVLARNGIEDINDFGLVEVPADIGVTPVYEYRMEDRGGEEGVARVPYVVGYTGPDGKPVDPSLVKVQEVQSGGGDSNDYSNVYTAPLGTNKVFGNIKTGKALNAEYDRANVDAGIWSGTFAGKDSTHYGVTFGNDGKPIFYTQQGESTNDLVQIMSDPIFGAAISAATAYLGGPLAIAALGAAQGKDVGDIIKDAALTYAGGKVSSFVSGSDSVINTLGNAGAKIAGSVAGAVVIGKDPITAAIGGGLGTMAGESLGLKGDFASTIGTSVVSGVAASLRGQDVTDAMITGAVTGYLSNSKKTGRDISSSVDNDDRDYRNPNDFDDSRDLYDPYSGFDATANEGSLAKKTNDGSFLSRAGDVASDLFTGTSGKTALATGVITGVNIAANNNRTANINANNLANISSTTNTNTNTNTSTLNLSQDDLYKDAPIKGYHMKQNAEGRYIPYIGDRALLAKGGFINKRISKKTGKSPSFVTRQK